MLDFLFDGENGDRVVLIGKYYVLCCIFHILSAVLSSGKFDAYDEKKDKKSGKVVKTTFADKVNWDYTNASILYCAVIFYFYVMAVVELQPHGLEGRWSMETFNSTHGIALHIASSLYETTCYIFAKKGLVFYAHHVVTICGCCTMLFFGKAAYWCCLLGLVEGTNIPLGIVLGGPFRTTSFKNTLLYKINGIVLWIMYVILRGPVIFALYFLQQDINEHGDTTAYLIKGNDRVNLIWNGYMWLVGLFLWGLSIVWFTQITNGMLKALGFKKSKTSKKVE
mmetsp:Transcript_10675/g.12242  ORF Transcript_10675/g.12242 Transcript_10675/m.12242 type:complete len:280 (-) Transcript_10675:190-1029(-)|eukprot:CAMPEP_0194130420 /NCGR_PEP_ID=MMETSP0152-20130528/1457_1 /TAXON_ID=1049557 /ORGANISM="Thalassiothrix antarctica, Strain L6-D1" /LENGTH=279 /DNA_ID=CAMNT_0038824929 /DNA_START=108 /DNA_END=947 /DNA_ORIENTATION=+